MDFEKSFKARVVLLMTYGEDLAGEIVEKSFRDHGFSPWSSPVSSGCAAKILSSLESAPLEIYGGRKL